MSSSDRGASGTGVGVYSSATDLFQNVPYLLGLSSSPPKAPVTFFSRLHGKLSPHLTQSNLQRSLVTLFILVISYAILTTPEARRKVMKYYMGPPRWIIKRIRKRVRRMYSKVSGRTLDESEDGFFIEEAPKKSRTKRGGRRSSSRADVRDGRSSFLGGKLRRPPWSYLSEEKRLEAAKDTSDVPSGGITNNGTQEAGDTSSVDAGGSVHLTRTSVPVAPGSSATPTRAAAVASRDMLLSTTPDMSSRRRNRYAAAAAIPSPIYERNELQSPSPQHHKSAKLRHAYLARLSPTKAPTTASSLCTGLFLPESTHEEETDHDRFTRAWPRIRSSAYGRLVLPPECRFVGHSARADEEGLEGEETTVMSWWLWFLHLLLLFLRKSKDRAIIIATCDYAAVLTAAYLRLMDYIRYKRDKMLGRPTPDEEDEDDDDEDDEEDEHGEENDTVGGLHSVNSSSSLRQLMAAGGLMPAVRDRFYSVDPNAHVNDEEKKEPAADRTIISTNAESLSSSKDAEGGPSLTPIISYHGATETWTTPNDFVPSPGTLGGMVGRVNGSDLVQNNEDRTTESADQAKNTGFKPKRKSRFVLTTPGGDGSVESDKGATLKKRDNLGTSDTNVYSSNVTFHSDRCMPDLSPRPLLQSKSTPLLSNVATDASVSPESPLRSRDGFYPEVSVASSAHHDLAFFDAPISNACIKRLNRDVPLTVPDKNGYIIGDDLLPDSQWTPLLVFVNSRSGPQQGQLILMQLRRLLNPIQIWDLADGDPTPVLRSFLVLSRLRILVCGGDGTVSWIISTLENMKLERRWPPISILPLGTGNDLARVHGWGAGYNNESILMILEQITEAYVSLLDRWELTIESKKRKTKDKKSFMNYLGVGVDAQTALGFHRLRENRPALFFSRAVNKAWYVISGAEDAIKASCAGLSEDIILVADGVEVPVPPDSQGIILLNIDSYAGGVPLWSHGERPQRSRGRRHSDGDLLARQNSSSSDDFDSEEFARELDHEEKLSKVTACDMPSSCQDGLLDIVSIKSIFHMGQIKVGLSRAQLICQCSEVEIRLKKRVPLQIDGEPWKQNSGTIRILRKKEPALMLHRAAADGGGIETEVGDLLEWAEERQIIDKNVHATLMKEFSRRIESKNRARRVLSNDNLFSTMKRAIGATSPQQY